jgi:small subunit ribosomal protein S16
MALKIRLRRMGRKKAPTYRLVVAESSMPRDGRFVANIGHYNPRTEPITLVVDREQALQWIAKGATPTDTAKSLLRKAGVFKPEAPVSEAVEAVKETVKDTAKKAGSTAKKAGSAVAAAAGSVAETVTDAAASVVETVREKA